MNRVHKFAASLAAMAMLAAMPVHAQQMSNAEKLRRLDIMLMVTGLRCRTTSDDFQADFQAFEAHHLTELNDAARQLHEELAARLGRRAADDEADRLSVTMANAYGNGHPWLGCAELKQMTRDLALAQGVELLLDAADATLFSERQGRVAVNWH